MSGAGGRPGGAGRDTPRRSQPGYQDRPQAKEEVKQMSDGGPRAHVGPEIGWENGSEGFDALPVGIRDPPPTHQVQDLEILDEPVDEEHGSAPSVPLSPPDAVRED